MNKFDIKDGEYTSTIYGLIKVKSFLVNMQWTRSLMQEQRFPEAIDILTFIYDNNPSSRSWIYYYKSYCLSVNSFGLMLKGFLTT